ncbi:hypothetical protein PGT21_003751 [Puccinia graminis f. sp. tritici]|uniref:Uncharacterized protein n=1 Tax=Puccinia graminis f. sp. tritici TaxID=56615 RepID=A0A5B0SHA7_PUCGR|nr:hypothetical protein PGT21_003751 [Puccinia graminis f. sp. tritici]KAA1137408.1 hypothetical protein PGTUg99_009295 [Puccinia graminis f. sp. tritici]
MHQITKQTMHSLPYWLLILSSLLAGLVIGDLTCKCGETLKSKHAQMEYMCGSSRRTNNCSINIVFRQFACSNRGCKLVAMVPDANHCSNGHDLETYYYTPSTPKW